MTTRFWVKLYIEMLHDPMMGQLPNHLWRRAVECILLAGQQGDDGALPPVEKMAWILRLEKNKVLEDLHCLEEAGVVHEASSGNWIVTRFKEQQAPVSGKERVRQYRERHVDVTKRYTACNEVATHDSISTSPSPLLLSSVSDSSFDSEGEVGVQGEERGQDPPSVEKAVGVQPLQDAARGEEREAELPGERYPREIRVYMAVTDGRLPREANGEVVIGTIRWLREQRGMDDRTLVEYLRQFWEAWIGRTSLDGHPYSLGNLAWLTDWAVNDMIPAGKTCDLRPEEMLEKWLHKRA